MDLSKAFDCLPHGLIMTKLLVYGVTTAACELLFSYLHERKQGVKISSSRSDWTTLSKEVSQGSILGPLLFNIFMNDLFLFIEKCNLYNYADDNLLDSSSENLSELLINLKVGGRNAIDWFIKNGMQANPDKLHFMLLFPTPMNLSNHISACCSKTARQLNALARIVKYIDIGSPKTIYNSFILSNFNYCPLMWHFCGKTNNDKLEKIPERALRILYQDHNSSNDDLLKTAGTSTLLIQRLRLMILTVFKSLNSLNPPCLNGIFTK